MPHEDFIRELYNLFYKYNVSLCHEDSHGIYEQSFTIYDHVLGTDTVLDIIGIIGAHDLGIYLNIKNKDPNNASPS